MSDGYGVGLVGLWLSLLAFGFGPREQERNNHPLSTLSHYSPLSPTPQFFPIDATRYAYVRTMSIFVADYQQVIVELKKLSPKNLHMSKVVITFDPSII